MNILEVLVDLLISAGPPRADNDHSIVGKSPMEENLARFWRRLGLVLLLAVIVAFVFVRTK